MLSVAACSGVVVADSHCACVFCSNDLIELDCDELGCDALPPGNGHERNDDAASSFLDPWLPRSRGNLPLWKSLVEGRDVRLPPPIGAGYVITALKRHVAVTDVRIGLNGGPQQSLQRVSVDEFTTSSVNQIFRGDAWILPCLNVYGIVGETRTKGNVVINVEDFPFPFSPPFSVPINIKLDGLTYGGGATVGIGTKRYFASLDVNYTQTDFNQLASELSALVIAPRFGMVFDGDWFNGEIHLGAMYQDTAQTIQVIIDQPLIGSLDVSVDQIEPDPWNFLIGSLWAIDERVHAIVEFGAGGREYVIAGVTVRF
jgi:hypothetical protein